jgi:uncharacterized protein
MLPLNSMQAIHDILRASTSIAVVGFSPKATRPSHIVGKYLIEAGFRVYPVNPGVSEILGHVCYPDLFSIPDPIDLVDIFRRSEDVTPFVEAAIRVGAKVIWMQQGIINEEAANIAEKSGLQVVMDRCIKIDHMQLL